MSCTMFLVTFLAYHSLNSVDQQMQFGHPEHVDVAHRDADLSAAAADAEP